MTLRDKLENAVKQNPPTQARKPLNAPRPVMPVHLTLEQAIGKNAYFEIVGRDGMVDTRLGEILKTDILEWDGRTFTAFWVKFQRISNPRVTAACWFRGFQNPLVNFTPDVLESFK